MKIYVVHFLAAEGMLKHKTEKVAAKSESEAREIFNRSRPHTIVIRVEMEEVVV